MKERLVDTADPADAADLEHVLEASRVLPGLAAPEAGCWCPGPTYREEVTERHVREDLVGPVLGALPLALPPELLQPLEQGPRGAEEEGILLGDGVVQGRVLAVAVQPATENGHLHGRRRGQAATKCTAQRVPAGSRQEPCLRQGRKAAGRLRRGYQ